MRNVKLVKFTILRIVMTVSEIAKAVTGNVIATKTVKVENDKRSQYPLKKTSDIQY